MKYESIKSFLELKNIAVVGVSSTGKGFGVSVYEHLNQNGYNVFGVNKNGGYSNDIKLYNSLTDIPANLDGVITVVPPIELDSIVREANNLGIKKIWMQQGSESKSAINYCRENKIDCVSGECIFMYSEPVKSLHSFHRWINKLIGKYPKIESAC